MFLHRTTSTASLSSIRTTDSFSRPRLASTASIGWSAPSIAADSVNVSAQVHYSYLASQYRAQSAEKGLGIAARGYGGGDEQATTRGQAITSTSIPDETSEEPRSQAEINARKFDSLFAGSRRAAHRSTHDKDAQHPPPPATSPPSKRHSSGKHTSTRGYAKERIKAQEALEDVIAAATDTGRLKWEAKAALLSGSPSLAVIILIRAASLGSVSACISLAALYTTGVIKGGKPPVVLVHREPLPALAWLLEGARLLRRRREKGRAKIGWTGAALQTQKAASEKEALDQIVRTLALLERLLRTTQVASDLSPQIESESDEELLLPDTQALQAPLYRSALRSTPRAPSSPSLVPQMQLWPSVLEARLWLETELELLSPKLTTRKAAELAGPDDDIITELPAHVVAAHVHLHFVRGFAQTHSMCRNGVLEEKAIDALAATWKTGQETLAPLRGADKEELCGVSTLCNTFVPTLLSLANRQPGADDIRRAGADFWAQLEGTLPERHVPLPVKHASSRPTRPPTPKKEAASSPTRRRSLQDLPPVDIERAKAEESAHRPALLSASSAAEVPSPILAVDTQASTAQAIGSKLASPRKFLNRAISNAERPSSSLLSAPPTRSVARSRGADPSPSYSHHFGGRTISGSRLTVSAKRPSSVVSDSPSLLFGEEEPDGESFVRDSQTSHADKPSAGIAFPSSASASHDLNNSSAQPVPRRPGPGNREGPRRVASMYGEPSLNTQTIHSAGTTSAAYGHVGPGGAFDPTASLREGQNRRRRADSNASVATGTSIFSTQAMRNDQSFSPPDGHALGTMISHSGSASSGIVASASLRDKLGDAAAKHESRDSSGETSDNATPLLTERLERKLAESYASQRQPSYSGPRKDAGSINSRVSNASRRTGLSAFRSPSFFAPSSGGARRYHLGIFPKTATAPSLATTSENVEQQARNVGGEDKASIPAAQASTIRGKDKVSSSKAAKGARTNADAPAPKSALHSLRAVSLSDATAKISNSQRASSSSSSQRLPIPDFGQNESGAASPKTPSSAQRRTFSCVDPTSQEYAAELSPPDADNTNTGNTLAPTRTQTASPKPSIRSANSPRRVSPPGSVRSVRFDLPEPKPCEEKPTSRAGSRNNSPPLSPRPHSHQSGASSDLDPALARAEGRSKLKTQAGCENCGVLCINAPVDRKGRKFCSRECRIEVKEQEKAKEAKERPQQQQQQQQEQKKGNDNCSVRSSRSAEDFNAARSVRSMASLTSQPHSPKPVMATGA